MHKDELRRAGRNEGNVREQVFQRADFRRTGRSAFKADDTGRVSTRSTRLLHVTKRKVFDGCTVQPLAKQPKSRRCAMVKREGNHVSLTVKRTRKIVGNHAVGHR